jgi:P-type conjugative transfer protein TrbJ
MNVKFFSPERRRAVLTLSVGFLTLLLCATSASALFGVGDEVFDPTMYASQLQQLQQQTAEVTNLAQQLQYMIRNTTGGYGGAWRSDQSLLNQLGGLIQQQGGLSYTLGNLQGQFQRQFPGYMVPANANQQNSTNTAVTLNTLNGTLAAAQAQAQNFANEQATFAALEARNNTATGHMQAIQVGNEIALQQTQQIQLLRQLMVSMMNAQNVATANQINRAAAEDASAHRWLSAGPVVPFSTTMSGAPPRPPFSQ